MKRIANGPHAVDARFLPLSRSSNTPSRPRIGSRICATRSGAARRHLLTIRRRPASFRADFKFEVSLRELRIVEDRYQATNMTSLTCPKCISYDEMHSIWRKNGRASFWVRCPRLFPWLCARLESGDPRNYEFKSHFLLPLPTPFVLPVPSSPKEPSNLRL